MADALRFYMEFHSRFDGFYGAFIHDALAGRRELFTGVAGLEKTWEVAAPILDDPPVLRELRRRLRLDVVSAHHGLGFRHRRTETIRAAGAARIETAAIFRR